MLACLKTTTRRPYYDTEALVRHISPTTYKEALLIIQRPYYGHRGPTTYKEALLILQRPYYGHGGPTTYKEALLRTQMLFFAL